MMEHLDCLKTPIPNSYPFLHVNGKISVIHSSTRYSQLQPFMKSMASGLHHQMGTSKGAQLASNYLRQSFDKKTSMAAFQRRNRCNYNHKDNNFHEDKFEFDTTSTNNPHDLTMNPVEATIGFFRVLYRFIRPYAAVGTVLSAVSISLLAVEKLSDFSPLFFMRGLQALLGGIFMQMYVSCGFNQICDIEIDKVNKPFLPLAAGELSMRTAIIVSSLSAIMSFLMAWIGGSTPLFWGLFGWFLVGTAYSANVLPLLRWKRFPFTAALYMIIARAFTAALYMIIARAFVVPPAYYLHTKNSIHGGTNLLSRETIFAVGMLTVFSLATIFFKDIPDIEGDQMHGIKSLASRLGPIRMFWSCIWVLEMAYVAAIFVGATSSFAWSKYLTITGHLVMGSILWIHVKSVDLKSMEAIQSMYMFLWKLFYVEYCLILLVR